MARLKYEEQPNEKPTNQFKIRPLHERVIVKRAEEENSSKGGIIIPDTAKEKPIRGSVLAVGSGRQTENGEIRPLDVQPGNEILFGKYSGTEVEFEGEEFVIVREDDILGILD